MERITPKVALFARLEAKPGKENEVAKFLEAGLAMAKEESTTPLWSLYDWGRQRSASSTRLPTKADGRRI